VLTWQTERSVNVALLRLDDVVYLKHFRLSRIDVHLGKNRGGGGGGILNHAGTLTLNSSTVDHNTAPGGGGIASGTGSGNTEGGSLVTLNKSVISDNSAFGGQFAGGGGVANGGTLVSNSSQITGNTAPGALAAGS